MAQNVTSTGNNCAYYLNQATTNQTLEGEICAQYDLTNLTSLQTFMNATWFRNQTTPNYGGYYTDALMSSTGLTQTEIATLFDTAVPTSFGSLVLDYAGLVSVKYGCLDSLNCTSDELARLQWGSSAVTLNPLDGTSTYTPPSNTASDWSSNLNPPTEYFYWAQSVNPSATALSVASVAKIQSDSLSSYGLLNLYNSMKLACAYFSNEYNVTTLEPFNLYLGIDSATFAANMVYFVEGWMMEGSWATYSNHKLFFGWTTSDIAEKANGGDFWQGADFNV
jgi:hypothetical protein